MVNGFISAAILENPRVYISGDVSPGFRGAMVKTAADSGGGVFLLDPGYIDLFRFSEIPRIINYSDDSERISEALDILSDMNLNRLKIAQKADNGYPGNDLYIFVSRIELLNKNDLKRITALEKTSASAGIHLILFGEEIPGIVKRFKRFEWVDNKLYVDKNEQLPVPELSWEEMERIKPRADEPPGSGLIDFLRILKKKQA